jgi:hypothetical protein
LRRGTRPVLTHVGRSSGATYRSFLRINDYLRMDVTNS